LCAFAAKAVALGRQGGDRLAVRKITPSAAYAALGVILWRFFTGLPGSGGGLERPKAQHRFFSFSAALKVR
jgi:hypothetical protein